MENRRKKILVGILASMGVGFSVLFLASYAFSTTQGHPLSPFGSQISSQNMGFSGLSQFTMIPSSAGQQMMGGGAGFGPSQAMNDGSMNPNMMSMMNMMNMMMGGRMSGGGMNSMSGMNSMQGTPMMNAYSLIPLEGPSNNSGGPLDTAKALSTANNFLVHTNNQDFAVGILDEYSNYFYVAFQEKSTGEYAFDVLIDRMTGAVYADPGPNTVWNTKYLLRPDNLAMPTTNQGNIQYPMMMGPAMGSMMMGGGMSTGGMNSMNGMSSSNGMNNTMTQGGQGLMKSINTGLAAIQVNPYASTIIWITPEYAKQLAQQFLNLYLQGLKVDQTRVYYGYYVADVLVNGTDYPTVAINGYTGQVWYETWHTGFLQKLGGGR